jgi:beta-galactosidase
MLVIDEAFDAWEEPKHGQVTNGYNSLFREWSERDLTALIRRDRNHPSVIMWSLGNEVPEQTSPRGAELAARLADVCRRHDPTRPTTAGYNHGPDAEKNGLCDAVDIVGLNYEHHNYRHYKDQHPHWIVYGSETNSCVSSRGVYDPVLFDACRQQVESPYAPNSLTDPVRSSDEPMTHVKRDDLHVCSFDIAGISAPDYEMRALEECPWVLGEFVWTGIDYLGEPAPYMTEWPSRSSYFGILDTCGFPKDRYYLYKAQWGNEPVLHVLPHWTWPGNEGRSLPVMCYTTYPAAELFVNGTSMGVREKNADDVFERFRLIWRDVRYEPGSIRVVAYDDDRNVAAETTIETAGGPAAVRATVDRDTIAADGDDLAFVTLEFVDSDGRRCPTAADRVTVRLDGPADLLAIDNGDPTDLEPFAQANRRAFAGLALAIVRSRDGEPGRVTVTASAGRLEPGSVVVELDDGLRRRGVRPATPSP